MPKPNFNRLARPYRWLEYLTFGPTLERCRTTHLDRLHHAHHVLVLGDGDGRFTAALLARHPHTQVVAVDSSPAMLALLQARAAALGASARLTPIQADALTLLAAPSQQPFDHLCSHFFLDCLSTPQVEQLAQSARAHLTPGALWLISEFETPHPPARLVVAALYLAFAALTGLRTRHLPNWRQALLKHGWVCIAEQTHLTGLLSSTLWRLPGTNMAALANQPASPTALTNQPRATTPPSQPLLQE